MASQSAKTNAMRMVESARVPFRVGYYDYDENDLNGMHAAEGLGMPYGQVFKTLVTKGASGNFAVFILPVDATLDRKAAARAAGEKNLDLIPVKDLLPLTGYLRGGCSPIGMKKKFPTYLDQSALNWPEIAVSAGKRGEQLILAPADLIKLTSARTASLTAADPTAQAEI